jgi:hypothetical protein
MMRSAILVLLFLPIAFAGAQTNIVTKKMAGMTHYEHEFRSLHLLGDIGELKYPHVQMYCRTNDSAMMVFKLIIVHKGSAAAGDEETIPILECDGDRFKSNSMSYESFPLKDGVLETFSFYLPSLWMEALGNSDDVVVDIGGAQFSYPNKLRQDYRDLHKIVTLRNKDALLDRPRSGADAPVD